MATWRVVSSLLPAVWLNNGKTNWTRSSTFSSTYSRTKDCRRRRTGNWFQEHSLCICRLDKLSRNEDIQDKLVAADWDLVIVDEAHKMSASYFGSEKKYTKRFKLGRKISEHTRQLLLLTATPHNGKEQDFHLFLSFLMATVSRASPATPCTLLTPATSCVAW